MGVWKRLSCRVVEEAIDRLENTNPRLCELRLARAVYGHGSTAASEICYGVPKLAWLGLKLNDHIEC